MLRDKAYVLAKLEWMRENRTWPNGKAIELRKGLAAAEVGQLVSCQRF